MRPAHFVTWTPKGSIICFGRQESTLLETGGFGEKEFVLPIARHGNAVSVFSQVSLM